MTHRIFRANLDPNKTYTGQQMVEHLIYLWINDDEEKAHTTVVPMINHSIIETNQY